MGVHKYLGAIALLTVVACQDDNASIGDSEETDSTTDDEESESGSTEETESTETDEGESEETGTDEPYCGDGNLDEDEECDDGNDVDDDGCNNECISACGADFATDIKLDDETEWWDIQLMRPELGGGITLMGGIWNGGAGRVRVASFMDGQFSTGMESPALGSLDEIHEVTHARMSAGGEVLALGRSVDPDENYWLARFDSTDLSEQWRVPVGGADVDHRPMGVAVLDSGDPVITYTSFVADNDDDVLVARHGFSDGAELWSAEYSGELVAGFSYDEAWGVAAGEGNELWAMGRVRVDYQSHDTTVFRVDPNDGALLDSWVPLADPGGNHRQRPIDIAAGPNGDVALGFTVFGPASKWSFSRAYRYQGDELVFELTRDDLPWEDGDPYIDPRVSIDADGNTLVAGTYTHEFGFASAARVWVVKFDPEGQLVCYARVGEGNKGGVVPRVGFHGNGRAAVNLDAFGPGGMGPGSGNNWLIGLRE